MAAPFPIKGRGIIWESIDAWDIGCLASAAGGAEIAAVTASDANFDDVHHLYIPVAPVGTLKARLKAELQRPLDPASARDSAAFESMMAHLLVTELCRYRESDPYLGDAELGQLRALFARGQVCADGLMLVARGYAPAFSDSPGRVDGRADPQRWHVGWVN